MGFWNDAAGMGSAPPGAGGTTRENSYGGSSATSAPAPSWGNGGSSATSAPAPSWGNGDRNASPAAPAGAGTGAMGTGQTWDDQGWGWGGFGSKAQWEQQFAAQHGGRRPTIGDEKDFWESQVFAEMYGRGPTQSEWQNKWESGFWHPTQEQFPWQAKYGLVGTPGYKLYTKWDGGVQGRALTPEFQRALLNPGALPKYLQSGFQPWAEYYRTGILPVHLSMNPQAKEKQQQASGLQKTPSGEGEKKAPASGAPASGTPASPVVPALPQPGVTTQMVRTDPRFAPTRSPGPGYFPQASARYTPPGQAPGQTTGGSPWYAPPPPGTPQGQMTPAEVGMINSLGAVGRDLWRRAFPPAPEYRNTVQPALPMGAPTFEPPRPTAPGQAGWQATAGGSWAPLQAGPPSPEAPNGTFWQQQPDGSWAQLVDRAQSYGSRFNAPAYAPYMATRPTLPAPQYNPATGMIDVQLVQQDPWVAEQAAYRARVQELYNQGFGRY